MICRVIVLPDYEELPVNIVALLHRVNLWCPAEQGSRVSRKYERTSVVYLALLAGSPRPSIIALQHIKVHLCRAEIVITDVVEHSLLSDCEGPQLTQELLSFTMICRMPVSSRVPPCGDST